MSERPARALPDFARTTKLVARAVQMSPDELLSSVRPATEQDLPDIVALRGREGGDDTAYLRWRYRLGRPGCGQGDLWVLWRGETLLGMLGLEDITLRVGQHECTLPRLMDLRIQPDVMDAGLGLWFIQFMMDRFPDLITVGPNPLSIGLVTRVFERLPDMRLFVRPIRFEHYLGKRFGAPVLSGLAAALANVASVCHMRLALWPGRQGVQVSRMREWPADLGGLIEQAQHPERVEVLRSQAYWAWRVASPRARFEVWLARDRSGQRLLGLMIIRVDEREPGRKSWHILDLVLAPSHRDATLRALLRQALIEAKADGAEQLACLFYRQDIEPELKWAGLVHRPEQGEAVCWRCQDEVLRAQGAKHGDWSLNELHTDTD